MSLGTAVIIWVLSSGVAAFVASVRGRSVGGFAVLGLLLGPLAIVAAALMPKRTDDGSSFGSTHPDVAAEIQARKSEMKGKSQLDKLSDDYRFGRYDR